LVLVDDSPVNTVRHPPADDLKHGLSTSPHSTLPLVTPVTKPGSADLDGRLGYYDPALSATP